MSPIANLTAREVLDSRGNPTVEVTCRLDSGASGSAIVPSGASTGTLRGEGAPRRRRARFGGKGVLTAVGNVTGEIADALCGQRRLRPARRRLRLSRSRRHARQVPPRRQRHRSALRWRSRGRPPRTAARRSTATSAASTPTSCPCPDERAERGRARRQQRRLPGVHDRPRRAPPPSPRPCAGAPRPTTP